MPRPNLSVRSLAVIEALRTCSHQEMEDIAKTMEDRILYFHYNIEPHKATIQDRNMANFRAVSLLQEIIKDRK